MNTIYRILRNGFFAIAGMSIAENKIAFIIIFFLAGGVMDILVDDTNDPRRSKVKHPL
jgi:hypothetical protein